MSDTDGGLERTLDRLNNHLYGMTVTQATNHGICIRCKQNVLHETAEYYEAYLLTGLCSPCNKAILEDRGAKPTRIQQELKL